MVGKFIPFNPKGTHFSYKTVVEPAPPPAPCSSIALNSIGAGPGDWIALQGQGSWLASSSGASFSRMSGLFRSRSSTGYLKPGPSGQEAPFDNWPPNTGEAVKVFDDFNIPYDQTTIVRAPASSVEILLHSGDWKFTDNAAGANCGVLVTLPNRPRPVPAFTGESPTDFSSDLPISVEPEPEQELREILFSDELLVPFPNATHISAGPFAATSNPATTPQWRGWYRQGLTSNGAWKPAFSHWNANRPNSTHKGWDLFAPKLSTVIVPVAPCYVQFIPNVPGYGNTVVFRFSKNAKKYSAIYAHCDSIIGPEGQTNAIGANIALTGCSGNAGGENCGMQLTQGGRTDHVHFGLYEGEPIKDSNPGAPVDPATIFNWSPVTPT